MERYDLTIIEMLGSIYEDLDIDKIEEKFVELVSDVFGFDRVALFFVKHKKEALQGKLSKGFDPDAVGTLEIPLRGDSELIKPLLNGIPSRSIPDTEDRYLQMLGLRNFALVPVINKKSIACWKVRGCRASDCPAYGKKWLRCWLVSGTKCSSGANITAAQKTVQCSTCPVFADLNLETVEGVLIVDNSLSGKPISDEVVTAVSIIAHTVGMAINNSKLYMKTLDVAIRDALTDLHNRRYFNERLLDEVERARRYDETLSLIICDIDYFKNVNDTYGHVVGDRVLQWVADVLRQTLRKNDVLSRYGGEEFATLLTNTDKHEAFRIAQKLRSAFEQTPFRLDSDELRVTLSFGVSQLGVDSNSFEGLISTADKALYYAKARGRNMVCTA